MTLDASKIAPFFLDSRIAFVNSFANSQGISPNQVEKALSREPIHSYESKNKLIAALDKEQKPTLAILPGINIDDNNCLDPFKENRQSSNNDIDNLA